MMCILSKSTCISLLLLAFLCFPEDTLSQVIDIENSSKSRSFSGDQITITGNGFDNKKENLKVEFGGAPATILQSSKYFIDVVVPSGSLYDPIKVINKATGTSAISPTPFLLSFGGNNFNPNQIGETADFKVEQGLYDLCMCDFNNDGLNDIATANEQSNFINVLINTSSTIGEISFSKITISINSGTQNVQCADLDNDGNADILLSKQGTPNNIIYYVRNTTTYASVSFAVPVPITMNGEQVRRMEVSDLNGDGTPEVVVSSQSSREINILVNESTPGTISFNHTPIVLEADGLTNSAGIQVKDLNHDKYPDIAVSQYLAPDIFIFTNESEAGNINFSTAQRISVDGNLVNIAVANINSDNRPDLIATKLTDNEIAILKNTTGNSGGTISFASEQIFHTVNKPWGIGLGDINGDGNVDLSISSIDNNTRYLGLFINQSDNGFSFTNYQIATTEKVRNIKIGDVDGDGKPDFNFTSIDSDNISVIPNRNCVDPRIFQQEDQVLCAGSNLVLETIKSPGLTYLWYKDDGSTEELVKEGSEAFYEEMVYAGIFSYRVATLSGHSNCGSSSPPVRVDVVAEIASNATGIYPVEPVCEGDDFSVELGVEISALPQGARFLWRKPDESTVETENPVLEIVDAGVEDAGRYTVRIETNNCLSEPHRVKVRVISLSNIEIESTNALALCEGEYTMLSIPANAGNKYQWFKENKPIDNGTQNTITVSEEGEYTVEVTTVENCTALANSVFLEIFEFPVADFELYNIGCLDQEIELESNSVVDPDATINYLWDFGDGKNATGESVDKAYFLLDTYEVTLTVNYEEVNCSHAVTKTVEIVKPAVPEIVAEQDYICQEEEVALSMSSDISNVVWNDGTTGHSVRVDASGIYTAEGVDGNGCEVESSITIIDGAMPLLKVASNNEDNTIERGKPIRLLAEGADHYTWSPSGFLDDPELASPIAKPQETTLFTVTGSINNACSAQDTITIFVIDPAEARLKVLNPNGLNPVWTIQNQENNDPCTLVIFDRFGSKVFEGSGSAVDWDGTGSSGEMPRGTYFYIFSCGDNKPRTGSILLVRT